MIRQAPCQRWAGSLLAQGPDQHEHEEEQVAELAGVEVHDGPEPGLHVAVDVLVADALAAAVGAALALAALAAARRAAEEANASSSSKLVTPSILKLTCLDWATTKA